MGSAVASIDHDGQRVTGVELGNGGHQEAGALVLALPPRPARALLPEPWQQRFTALEQFERAVQARPEVMECYLMTGDADYHLRVVVEDLSAYERFLMDHLTRVPGIANIRSSFALKQVKYTTALPIND